MPSRAERIERTYQRWVPPYWEFPNTAPTEDEARVQTWTNDLLISENHRVHSPSRLRGGANNVGGPFLAHKREYHEQILADGSDAYFAASDIVEGAALSPFFITNQWPYKDSFGNSAFPVPAASSDAELGALGATAIARTAPTKPNFDLSTFLAEAREGLPNAVGLSLTGKARARQSLNAGDEYLNVEFGWKPLVSDVNKFMDSVKNSNEILEEYRNNSGKVIKRKYRWPTELNVKEESLGYRYPVPLLHPSCYTSGPPELHKLSIEKIERWFVATYVYYVPEVGTPMGNISDFQHLYGAKPTPATLWNAAPWSWAADWVGNVGDVMSNLSSFSTDGLVMPYAYVMEHRTITEEYWMECQDLWRSHPGNHVLRQTFKGESKKRIGASPYGFGLSWDGFSNRQLGILAALGVSRTR